MDWSYIAGFFDGEGNIHLVFTKKSLQIVCRMYGKKQEVFQSIIEFLGYGKVYARKKGDHAPELSITKKENAKHFLENIYPFSIIKKNHIKFVLENYDFSRNNNLNFNLEEFYKFVDRKDADKFRNPRRKEQIQERLNLLSS